MRCTIRIDKSVHTEIAIMNGFSMIPTVIISGLSIFCRSMCDCMITPLPYKTSTHTVILMNHLKIIFKISWSISHTVAVFHQQKRFASIIFQIIFYLLQWWIHPAVKIQIVIIICNIIITVSCTFVLCDPIRIKILCPSKCLFKIASICTFISHRPHYNAGTVFVPLYHKPDTIHNCLFPCRIICNLFIPTTKTVLVCVFLPVQHKWSMCLNIRLVNHHKSIFIAHLIKIWCIWIMAGTNSIKVMLLHQHQILFNLPDIDYKSCLRIRIMAVDATEFNLFSIEINNLVPNFNRPKTNPIHNHFIRHCQNNLIQIRILCIP